ncbi:C13 family peptidase, partial [Candidatus Venteria ishoeyi]|uniref:C13 family peptidase n=1 Tax=Candidatus Venteria ishoeyi TaxID=1899563 RepID=UPI0015AA7414
EGKVKDEEGLAAHNKTLLRIWRQLKERGFDDENIYHFNYDNTQAGVDAIPDKADLQDKVENWAAQRLNGSPAPLYIIMVDHGNPGAFILNYEHITPQELNTWLENLEANLETPEALASPRIVMLGACYSGSFIPELSGEGRIIITSATGDEVSYKGPLEADGIRNGEYFMENLFQRLGAGDNLNTAFISATHDTELFTRNSASLLSDFTNRFHDDAAQHPLLDDNGDRSGSNVLYSGGDGDFAQQIKLGVGASYSKINRGNLYITQVTETLILPENKNQALLWLGVNDFNRTEAAAIQIREPLPLELLWNDKFIASEQIEIDLPGYFPKLNEATGRFEFAYEYFDKPGRYDILYYIHDITTQTLDNQGRVVHKGDISPIRHSVVYKRLPASQNNQPPSTFSLLFPDANGKTQTGKNPQTALLFDWQDSVDPEACLVTYNL